MQHYLDYVAYASLPFLGFDGYFRSKIAKAYKMVGEACTVAIARCVVATTVLLGDLSDACTKTEI